ncbi:MAG: DUF3298 domain-containing protein [Lachnospiraceae bacterium]|nr:DUF3298 domain-containing protein [Lachnospiraceae bacterium]
MTDKIDVLEKNMEKELQGLKEEYLKVEMSQFQLEQLKHAMEQGKKENRIIQKKHTWRKRGTIAAAVVMAFLVLPNTSQSIAFAMEQMPLLGKLVKIVTIRNYEYEDEKHFADVELVKVEIASNEETEEALTEEMAAEAEQQLKKTSADINEQIETITAQLVEEFETHMREEEGYLELIVKNEVIATTPEFFTLKLMCYEAKASGYEWNYFYTIDLNTGKQIFLKDLFKDNVDYITVVSENIISQMRKQMAEDENVIYWLDEEIEEWNFKTITEETSFYLNEKGNLVISFNEAEVGPACMGAVEFEIEKETIANIVR